MDTRHEVEVDTALAELWGAQNALYVRLDNTRQTIARLSGAERLRTRRGSTYLGTADEWRTALRAKLADMPSWDARAAKAALENESETLAKIERNKAEAAPLEAEYNAAPWSRFFLVQNTNGHIHSSMNCSTCHPTTRFAWLPTLSGLTEADAVKEHGTILCSVCYPSAPVEWTVGKEKPVDPDQCPGTGTHDHDSSGLQYYSPRARCNHCRRTTSVTSTGKLRKHKKEA